MFDYFFNLIVESAVIACLTTHFEYYTYLGSKITPITNYFELLQNLLQGETEGVNDENIGFYGRCLLHPIGPKCQSIYDPIDEMGSRKEKEFTCARTEVPSLL